MGGMRRAITVALLGSIGLGCGALLSLDPLTFVDETMEAAPPDANGDAEPRDGGIDVAPPDAGLPDGAQHCSDGLVHDFCDDFEGTRSSVQGNWTNAKSSGTGGALTIEGGVLLATAP